jgi:hypothetical protein
VCVSFIELFFSFKKAVKVSERGSRNDTGIKRKRKLNKEHLILFSPN